MKEIRIIFRCYRVVRVDGIIRECIDIGGKPNKYGKPKIFATREKAQEWIDKRSYPGMSWHYEIMEDIKCITTTRKARLDMKLSFYWLTSSGSRAACLLGLTTGFFTEFLR